MEQTLSMKEKCRVRFEPAVNRVKELLQTEEDTIIIAIDGMSASGKSTLGFYLKELFDCNLFHMDDFFLQDHQRSRERLEEVGGNVDYERFKEEVLMPIANREVVVYRPFSCKNREIQEGEEITFKRLNVIEGSYSHHSYFDDIYNQEGIHVCKLFTEISEELQVERIRKRNGEKMLERFLAEWVPKENAYFEKFHVKEKSCLIL